MTILIFVNDVKQGPEGVNKEMNMGWDVSDVLKSHKKNKTETKHKCICRIYFR